jgi:hypothetical protein
MWTSFKKEQPPKHEPLLFWIAEIQEYTRGYFTGIEEDGSVSFDNDEYHLHKFSPTHWMRVSPPDLCTRLEDCEVGDMASYTLQTKDISPTADFAVFPAGTLSASEPRKFRILEKQGNDQFTVMVLRRTE